MFNRKNFLILIKKKLQAQRKELLSQLSEIAKKSDNTGHGYEAKFPQYGRSDDENADEVSAFTDILSQKEKLENSLKDTEAALLKIKEGKYGICEKCGKKIKKERLEALPTARYCLYCEKNS